MKTLLAAESQYSWETWLDDRVPDREVEPATFTLVRADRDPGRGFWRSCVKKSGRFLLNKIKLRSWLSFLLLSLILSILFLTLPNLYNQLLVPFKSTVNSTRPGRLTTTAPHQPLAVCSSTVKKAPLVAIAGTHTFMVSAYFEHRSGKPEIRIIAIVLRSEKAVFQCLFCCDGQKYNSSAVYSIHSDHYKFDYGTADIMCPVPHRCEVPNHIALYIDLPDEEPPFTPVFNLRARNESFPYEFTVCISTMFDFDNVLQMVQTLEMFRLLGVQRVAIYRNSCSRTAQRVLDHYVKRDFVEVIDWPVTSYLNVSKGWQRSHSPGDLHYYGQIPALNDCVYRYMYQSRYVALQDIDELILPLSVDSWGELLPQLEMAYGPDVGFEFENNVFPSTVKQSNQSTWTDWQGVPGVNILEQVYREPNNPSESNNFKIIVNPRAVFSTTVHTLLHSKMGSVHVDRSVARIFHIRKPVKTDLSQGELILDQRLLYYADSLVPNVSKVLKETLQN